MSFPTRHFFSNAESRARASCSAEGREDGLVDLAVSISVVAWEIFSVVSEERSTRSSSWPPLALPADWAADMVIKKRCEYFLLLKRGSREKREEI